MVILQPFANDSTAIHLSVPRTFLRSGRPSPLRFAEDVTVFEQVFSVLPIMVLGKCCRLLGVLIATYSTINFRVCEDGGKCRCKTLSRRGRVIGAESAKFGASRLFCWVGFCRLTYGVVLGKRVNSELLSSVVCGETTCFFVCTGRSMSPYDLLWWTVLSMG